MIESISPTERDAIHQLIFTGRKIEAIKKFRELTGQGLKESKDFIEQLTQELLQRAPEKFTVKPGQAAGCSTVFFLFLAGAIGISWYLFI